MNDKFESILVKSINKLLKKSFTRKKNVYSYKNINDENIFVSFLKFNIY